ncbi:hypothetical protein [Kitasatospora sp. GP82]|uniref:hypothetical protein n=1 Tax=Kitasatospora sp. GP82 TaxID=3035089 RepID=UPI002475D720|nr:hypothetical protein [Kitasatospora sp. GP82]
MSSDRRPLWQPFSEPATDRPVQVADQARLLPVDRAPFLEPPADDAPSAPPAVPGARRRLGPGHLASAPDDRS